MIQLISAIMQRDCVCQNGNLMKQYSLPLTVKYPDTNYICSAERIPLYSQCSNSSSPVQTQAINTQTSACKGNICQGIFYYKGLFEMINRKVCIRSRRLFCLGVDSCFTKQHDKTFQVFVCNLISMPIY